MLDFLIISQDRRRVTGRPGRPSIVDDSGKYETEIKPKFRVGRTKDLMIKGSDFYAFWNEDKGLWSQDEDELIQYIDHQLDLYVDKNHILDAKVYYMWDSSSGMIDLWHKYVQKQMRDNYTYLNQKVLFSNDEIKREDYASFKLPYPLEEGPIDCYNKLISTLYSEEERHKIEYCIGSIVNGDSVNLQKFMVLYGDKGTGKSTILHIIQKLFDGYCATFNAKALGASNNSFALEPFKNSPLVAIQHDGDLSTIEDNSILNSLTSHEDMTVNEKHKNLYTMHFSAFVFMGTNKPVKITDAKSGILRRLIDVQPTGNKFSFSEYQKLMHGIQFELSGIAYHCKKVYEDDKTYYNNYIPNLMMSYTNDFYDFVEDSYDIFAKNDSVTLKQAWEMYNAYVGEAKLKYQMNKRSVKTELANYFREFNEQASGPNGEHLNNVYSGFRKDLFKSEKEQIKETKKKKLEKVAIADSDILDLRVQDSVFDKEMKDQPAQYANDDGTPKYKWSSVKTTLSKLDTTKLHYVKVPSNLIVIDFDIKGDDGEKSFEQNLKEAAKWPKTYTELSKSGAGIHLHYWYDGDPSKLSHLYSENVEIKTFSGNSSLRRRLSKCNNLPIAHISSGLPIREDDKMVNFTTLKNERSLRTIIGKNMAKQYYPYTKPSVDFIYDAVEEYYQSGKHYDISDLKPALLLFAASSTHQASKCIDLMNKMHYKSDDIPDQVESSNEKPIAIFDVEVFPNLFLINYIEENDPGNKCVRLINPSPNDIEVMTEKYRLVGFNNRSYDNHMLYARMIGYTNEQLYQLSQKIIVAGDRKAGFREAYNLSYTDIFDYASIKQSLKKWEIKLHIHHQELGLPWDKPVPEELWTKVAEYCDNDVLSTREVWKATQDDFLARKVLVQLANILCPGIHSTVNDKTNTLTGRVVFRGDRQPQPQFVYTDLSTGKRSDGTQDPHFWPGYLWFRDDVGKIHSYLFMHPEDKTKDPKRIQELIDQGLCDELNEGGFVWANPGIHHHVKTFDVASLHPHSVKELNLFGPYTSNYTDLVDIRVDVKHHDWKAAREMLGRALSGLISEEGMSDSDAKNLSKALKIAINAVYGLTSATFMNLFKDARNQDNIVAKRGTLFMDSLRHKVMDMGGTVVHIKTDSIKVENPTPEIENFILEEGKKYGYTFEIESEYERMCLVNNAVYIAKYEKDFGKDGGKWTATGTQFQIPYVFKTCFSHEPIVFEDLCETKEVKADSALYLADEDNSDPKQHNLQNIQFIGRVGEFCPIQKGCGGKLLVRSAKSKDGTTKYDSVTGTKGYFWLEAEKVRQENRENDIDRNYYAALVNDAIDTINKFGDYNEFVAA